MAPGRKAGLHPRLARQALLARLAGHKTRGDEHRGVRGIGAAGDRGDRDIAIAEVVVRALDRHPRIVVLAVHLLQVGVELVVKLAQQDAVLRPLGPRKRRLDRAHVELQRIGEHRLRCRSIAPQPLRLRVGLHQRDPVRVAAGQLEIIDRALVDGEETAGRAIFGRHVGDRCAVGDGHAVEAGAVEFDEAADDALLAQHLRDGQHQVGRGDAFLELAVEAEADDFRNEH